MNSKSMKVIDEHSIDRNANILFSMDIDGSDYVVYWIERDSDNDNLFVSKLIKNIDGTSNMINIEDTFEKGSVVSIVKELIKHAIDNENDKLVDNSIMLANGKNVKFLSVLINKEQNINVSKTYITTVKKSVVKVSSDFFDIKVAEPVVEVKEEVHPIVEPVVVEPASIPAVEPVVQPVVETPVVESVVEVPVIEPVKEEVIPTVVLPTVELPAVEPVRPQVQMPESAPIAVQPVVEPKEVVSAPEAAIPEPVVEDNTLVFDASKESNLNVALGEATSESVLPVDNVSPIREFGQEEIAPAPTPVAMPINQPEVIEIPKSRKAGFANNKFFMFVAIAFFLASCVFLGYEVFRYFQIS